MPTTPTAPVRSRPDRTIAGHAAYLAEQWVRSPGHWRHLIRHVPGERWYQPLFEIPGAAAWLITWAPGTGLPPHDHGGASGTFAVVEGELTERWTTADRLAGGTGTAPWSTRRLGPGALVAFASDHVHEVVNRGVRPAVSIHVYAPGLEDMVFYDAPAPTPRAISEHPEPRIP